MVVQYSVDFKHAYFDGRTFTRDEQTGYYLGTSGRRQRLHIAVYEKTFGEIPTGAHVHHVDCNKQNNEPDNLVVLNRREHERLHGAQLTVEQRNAKTRLLLIEAQPKAAAWHGSSVGREWHRKHGYEVARKMALTMYECQHCHKQFSKKPFGVNKFCSNACKSAHRRNQGVDNVDRACVVCGEMFSVSKYSKTRCCSKSCAWKFGRAVCEDHEHKEATETAGV